jgi:signal transduction histidine kinase
MHTATIPQSANRQFASFDRHRSALAVQYAVCAASVGAACILTGWLRVWFQGTPNSLFFCAIIISGWFGGFGPGLLASVLSILAIKYYFTPPLHNLAFSFQEIPRFAIFFLAWTFISWLCDRQRRDEVALMQARDELEGRVRARTVALTTANEKLTAEIAERTRAEAELQRLNRAWRVRSACNQAVTRCRDEPELLEQVCRGVVEEGGYRLAWAGYKESDSAKMIRPAARAGEALGYLDKFEVTWGGDLDQLGPTGAAIRTMQPVVTNDVSSDPRFAGWRVRAAEYGIRSSVSLPLAADGAAIGGLIVYSDEPGAFDEKETVLLQQAAIDLTHGIVLLRARKARQTAEEALKKTEEELDRVARVTTLGELAASIAHEVNQPLAAVVTNANASLRWLTADPPNFDEVRLAIGRIVRDGNRAGDVISRIRALIKKSEPIARRLDMNEIVSEIVTLLRSEAERRGVAVETGLTPHLPAVMGDRVRMQQVLLNLVMNALDATGVINDRRRVVRVHTAAPDPESIVVAVEDSGIGLDPAQLGRLFDAFYTTKAEGLGMGLSISRSIVEAHGGQLWATPNHGPGATFQFTLPTEEGAPA